MLNDGVVCDTVNDYFISIYDIAFLLLIAFYTINSQQFTTLHIH
jgi:hypothetical protein